VTVPEASFRFDRPFADCVGLAHLARLARDRGLPVAVSAPPSVAVAFAAADVPAAACDAPAFPWPADTGGPGHGPDAGTLYRCLALPPFSRLGRQDELWAALGGVRIRADLLVAPCGSDPLKAFRLTATAAIGVWAGPRPAAPPLPRPRTLNLVPEAGAEDAERGAWNLVEFGGMRPLRPSSPRPASGSSPGRATCGIRTQSPATSSCDTGSAAGAAPGRI